MPCLLNKTFKRVNLLHHTVTITQSLCVTDSATESLVLLTRNSGVTKSHDAIRHTIMSYNQAIRQSNTIRQPGKIKYVR